MPGKKQKKYTKKKEEFQSEPKQNYPQKGNQKIIETIKKIAKLKYGWPKGQVEAEISQRSRLLNNF